jgi:hypothetical protein
MTNGEKTGDDWMEEPYAVRFQQTFDWDQTDPTAAVVSAIATIEDVDPVDLVAEHNLTLYDWIDPEALDTILNTNAQNDVAVSFQIQSYRIRFEGNELTVSVPDTA